MKLNSLPQRVIYSIATLLIGIILSTAWCENLYFGDENTISKTWWIWIISIAFQMWIQNKIWDTSKEKIEFKKELVWLNALYSIFVEKFWRRYIHPNLFILLGMLIIITLILTAMVVAEERKSNEENRAYSRPNKEIQPGHSNSIEKDSILIKLNSKK